MIAMPSLERTILAGLFRATMALLPNIFHHISSYFPFLIPEAMLLKIWLPLQILRLPALQL